MNGRRIQQQQQRRRKVNKVKMMGSMGKEMDKCRPLAINTHCINNFDYFSFCCYGKLGEKLYSSYNDIMITQNDPNINLNQQLDE